MQRKLLKFLSQFAIMLNVDDILKNRQEQNSFPILYFETVLIFFTEQINY